jgi:hypothetical protein
MVALVEHGRGLEVWAVLVAIMAVTLFMVAALAAVAVLVDQAQVALHIMVAAVLLGLVRQQMLQLPLPVLQFMVVVQEEQLDKQTVLRVLEAQVNLVGQVAQQSILQRLYQGLYQQAAAAEQEPALLPAQVQQVKFV